MAIDFSSVGAAPAHTGKIDFSSVGGIPAVGQDQPADDTTALGAAGRGAVGMIPLGEQAYSAMAGAVEKKPYTQERQELEKEIEADKLNHGVARLAGQAAGIAAPAILTGGSSVPATLGEGIGEGALVGAGFGAGNAIDTLASGGSGARAAGDVALGTALGAGGGALGNKLAGMAGEVVPSIEKFAARKAAQGVGMGSDELGNMTQQELLDTGKMLMDKGIVKQGASTQEMFDTAKGLHEGYGEAIGKIGNQATSLGLTTDTKPILASLEQKFQAADALENPDERKAAIFYKKGMADILALSRRNLPETLADVQGAPVPSDITFDQLQRLKKAYGNSAFENGSVKNHAAADIYSALGSGQKAIVEKVRSNPNLPTELKDAMEGYSKMYPVVDGLQDVLGRERAGNMPAKGFGMMGKLVGQMPGQSNPAVNALTSLGLIGAGHPLWGIGAATATMQNPRAMASIASKVAGAIPEVGERLPVVAGQIAAHEAPSPIHKMMEKTVESGVHHGAENAIHQNMGETKPMPGNTPPVTPKTSAPTALNIDHPALAQWKPLFQKNAQNAQNPGETQKSNAVTDFVLSQRDPAYSAAKQKMSDNPSPEPTRPSTNMADGGVVPSEESKIDEPFPVMGSTLPGLAEQLKHPTHEAPPPPQETLPTTTNLKFHQPFNTSMADQLRAFLEGQKERDDAQSR